MAAALAAEAAAVRAAQGEQAELELGAEARAIAEAAGVLDGGAEERPDTLGLPDVEDIQAIMRELDCDVFQAVREHRRREGKGGRKKGSQNRRNAEFRKFVLASGGHPGIFLQRVYDRPTDLLAAELGCTHKEALDRQIRCASELMPFVEGKQPATVNLAVRGDMVLQAAFGTGLFDELDDLDEAEFDELPGLAFVEENQGLDDGGAGRSE
ncbi:MAG: hypothetical protein ACK4IS_13300 [Erythrobacter sp.]